MLVLAFQTRTGSLNQLRIGKHYFFGGDKDSVICLLIIIITMIIIRRIIAHIRMQTIRGMTCRKAIDKERRMYGLCKRRGFAITSVVFIPDLDYF